MMLSTIYIIEAVILAVWCAYRVAYMDVRRTSIIDICGLIMIGAGAISFAISESSGVFPDDWAHAILLSGVLLWCVLPTVRRSRSFARLSARYLILRRL